MGSDRVFMGPDLVLCRIFGYCDCGVGGDVSLMYQNYLGLGGT